MVVTPSGMETLLAFLLHPYITSRINTSPCPLAKPVQPLKALRPIDPTLFGTEMSVKLLQPSNACISIAVTLSGIEMPVRLLH